MRWLTHSIRWRLQAWHGLLLLTVLVALGVTIYELQRRTEVRLLDSEVQIRLAEVHSALAMQGESGGGGGRPRRQEELLDAFLFTDDLSMLAQGTKRGPRMDVGHLFGEVSGFYFRVWSRNGEVLSESPNVPEGLSLPEGINPGANLRTRGQWRECYEQTPHGECLLAGTSVSSIQATMRSFVGGLIGVGAVVMALGLLGGWWMISKSLTPVNRISSAATRIAGGHLDERIAVSETESELGQLAAVLNDTFARLQVNFAEQARFTSDAAHELRTPVAIILAQTQLALSRARSATADQKTIEMTQRAAQRIQSLTESLLVLARADAKVDDGPVPVCNLADLGRENLEDIRPLAEERGIQLSSELAPATCRADAGGITQILTNLLANAVKYSRSGDAVRLTTGRENGHVLVQVTDTGPGIAEEHLPQLFERFYRADASRSRNTGGAGLGLAICKALAEANGGRIEVSSKVGAGSIFTLRLPAE